MTHNDIYTKFMIEYDKANVTSSYPSLTEYEVATVLDKAYNALIAQKVTGNNVRRVGLEGDLKSVSDIQPLVIKKSYSSSDITSGFTTDPDDIDNTISVQVPLDFLYYIGCDIKKSFESVSTANSYNGPIDQQYSEQPNRQRRLHVKLVSHQMAENFKASASNIPWVKNPVCYIEDNTIYIVVDSYDKPKVDFCELTYIKTPNKFVKTLNDDSVVTNQSYFNYTLKSFVENIDTEAHDDVPAFTETNEAREARRAAYNAAVSEVINKYDFECNATVAEELISLAVAFALENVESQRLNTKLNMRGLEA